MSDSLEPPAKRARLDEPTGDMADVPGSPVDDMDDDFYDTTPAKPPSLPVNNDGASLSSAAAASAPASVPSLQLPGLGSLSSPSKQASPVNQIRIEHEGSEEGEVSDSEDLYNDAGAVGASATAEQPQLVGQRAIAQSKDTTTIDDSTVHANGAAHSREISLSKSGLSESNHETEAASNPANDVEDGELSPSVQDNAATQAHTGADDPKAEFLRAGEANKDNAQAEWQLDSEQSGSSSDSSSEDSDDGDGSDDGELLDPEEQIRRLMEEAANESGTLEPAKVRTQNEGTQEYKKPDITVTDATKITELGKVESIIDNLIVIKANTAGDYRVLESGSALCLGNRTVIGEVAEELGRVQEPRYSLGFADASEISTLGIAKDTPIFYVDDHSTFVFTEPLKAQKFTDASNLYDEETNEVEFSDDEKEAEYKRKQKEMKKAKAGASRDPQEKTPHAQNSDKPPPSHPGQYQGGGLNYGSDDDEDLGMYKRLARPDHFEDIVGAGAPVEDRSHVRRGNLRGRGGWPDRGRGFRGRGGQGGGRGNQRGRFPSGPAGPSGPPDRPGRHQEQNRHRNQPKKENRSASSASPNRQNQGRPPPQRSPARGKSHSRKRQRYGSSPAAVSNPPASANTGAYAQNSVSTSSAWSAPTSTLAPQQPYNHPTASQPTIPAGSYVNPAFYAQAAAAQNQQQQQQQIAQWTQWLQLAAVMSQNQNQGQPPPAPAPAPNPNPQSNSSQNPNPSLQDILRTLGGGSQNR